MTVYEVPKLNTPNGGYSVDQLLDDLHVKEKLLIYFVNGINLGDGGKAGFVKPIRIDADDRVYKGKVLEQMLSPLVDERYGKHYTGDMLTLAPKNYNNEHSNHIMAVYRASRGKWYRTEIVYSK
jgi:hypothetical protein